MRTERCNERERLLSASNYPWNGLRCRLENGYPNNTYNHNDYGDRVREIDFDPGKDFHVYGAQIDPEPGDPMHLAVTFLLDGRVRSRFPYKG